MDFIEGLPKSKGKDAILVVVDRLTKYAHFLAVTPIQCGTGGGDIYEQYTPTAWDAYGNYHR